jgi:hypothetical protein
MADYKRLNFKNHPSIATELVKSLAINTSFEAIDKVTTKAAWLELEVLDFKKQLAAANKAASSASKESDELKAVVAALAKRVGVVENKACRGTMLGFPPLVPLVPQPFSCE